MTAAHCNRCGILTGKTHLWMGKYWCDFCFEQQTGYSIEPGVLPKCAICEEELVANTSYRLMEASICMHCLLRLGPERAQTLVRVRMLKRSEVMNAVHFIKNMLNRNQRLRLQEAINQGGPNWWVKLPALGEYVCRKLQEQQVVDWDGEILEEVWDRLIEEAVEE